jgi:hypothetical protein
MRPLLVLLLLTSLACQKKTQKECFPEASDQKALASELPQLSKADSLRLLFDCMHLSPLKERVVRMMIDSGFYFVKTIPYLLNNDYWFSCHPFNQDSLIELRHNELYTREDANLGRTTSHLMLFRHQNLECIATDRLTGDHYEHEDVDIADWDKDGQDDIFTYHTYDVQSVPVTYFRVAIAKLDRQNNKFRFIFGTELDSYDCAMGVERGLRIKTRYRFINPQRIQLTARYYSFPCGETSIIGEVDWETSFKSLRLDSTKISYQNWNAKAHYFEEEK